VSESDPAKREGMGVSSPMLKHWHKAGLDHASLNLADGPGAEDIKPYIAEVL
jgi:hypothetical protein